MPYDKDKDVYRETGSRSDFGKRGRIISKSDTVDLPKPYAKAVTVLVAGTLKILPVENPDDEPIPYDEVPVGFSPPYQVRRVFLTGSTATVATVEN